jgi:TRAP-type C4-dicarboxylate transport system permease small subunit
MDLIPGMSAGPAPRTGWRRYVARAEESVVVVALAVMVILPCLEIVLRKFFQSGVTSSAPIVQHLVLLVGTLGAALAAREQRLL